jgi:tetratricopeptide (TPR) repeat protein
MSTLDHPPTEPCDAPRPATYAAVAHGGVAIAGVGDEGPATNDDSSETTPPADATDVVHTTPRWARFVFATTAVAALASVAWAAVSQLLVEGRSGVRPAVGAALSDLVADDSANPAVEAPPLAPGEPLQLLPKARSTNHLLAQGRVPVRTVSLPVVDVVAPKAAKPNPPKPAAPPPPLDPAIAAAVAEFAARLVDLEKQRLELVRNRDNALGEKVRLEKMIEQGKKDLAAAEQKFIECELAVAVIDLELDSYQFATGTRREVGAVIQHALNVYPRLIDQRAQLVVEQAKQRAEASKIRVRNELSYKQLLTLPPRIDQIAKQGEYFRRQWLRETCDWSGRRTRAEHEAAAALFTTAIEADRSNFAARLGRALSYMHLNRSADALSDLSTADAPTNPFRSEAVALSGYLKVFAGDAARGMIELGHAVTYDRRSLVPLLLRGRAAAYLRRFPQALADFKAAVQIDGANPDARRLLALYHAAAKYAGPRNLRESEGAARKAVDLTNQNDWQALLALAAAEADAGRFPQAAGHAADAANLTYDTHRDRCRELEKLFTAGTPLRLEWTPDGK